MFSLLIRMWILLVTVGLLGDCAKDTYQGNESGGRRGLMRNMFENGKVLWIYSTQDSGTIADYMHISKEIQASLEDRLQIIMMPDTAITMRDLSNNTVFFTGSLLNSNFWDFYSNKLPFTYQHDSLITSLGSYKMTDDDVWTLSAFPNPYNVQYPLYLYTGLSDSVAAKYLVNSDIGSWRWMFYNTWGYELFQQDKRVVMGYLKEHERGNWDFDPLNHWDYTVRPMEECISGHFEVTRHGSINESFLSVLLSELDNSCLALASKLELPTPSQPVSLHVYPSAEDKGLQMLNTDQMHVDFEEGVIYSAVHHAFAYPNVLMANRLFLRKNLGEPTYIFLEMGLAAMYSTPWSGEMGKKWGRRLYEANALLTPEALLSNENFERSSRLIRQISSALWVEFLWETWGKEGFLNRYRNEHISEEELLSLNDKWESFIKSFPYEPAKRHPKGSPNAQEFLKGFNFAHEGYRIYNGYVSRKAEESIAMTQEYGSNALAIIPYTGTRNVNAPQPFGFSQRAGSENDESVIFSTYYAHTRGMEVMLKPQIWVRGAWPGDIQMSSQEDWDLFFEYYRDWIMHYALLASLYNIEIFCVGVEMVHATLEQPHQWINLIRDIRKIYPGKLVYAANWGEEFEQLDFWDELDYIGIDCYYPLSNDESASKEELTHNFEAITHKLIAKSQKFDKPLIFTEIGFRSIEAPWQQPHDYPNGKASNDLHQAICYEVVADVLKDQDWCKGIFWWKWSSYLEHTEENPKEYSPYGKPAAQIIKKWFIEGS